MDLVIYINIQAFLICSFLNTLQKEPSEVYAMRGGRMEFFMKTSLNGKITTGHKNKWYKNINNWQLYSLCAVPMLLFLVFNYLPMIGIIIAFKEYKYDLGIIGSNWVGFKNFEFFFKSDAFYRITRNTLTLNAIFIFVGLIASVTVALLLFEIRKRTAVKAYQTMLIVPHYLSWVIVGYMAYAFLHPQYGFFNSALKQLGMAGIDWYNKPKYWPAILTVSSIWKGVGMSSVVYYASLMGIDTEYFEAAAIDGANKWQITWGITLPFLRPLMTILTILAIGNIFRADFGLFYQLTRDVGSLFSTTDVVDTYVYRTIKSGVANMSMSSAVGVLQSIVGFVLIIITNIIVKKIEPDNALF